MSIPDQIRAKVANEDRVPVGGPYSQGNTSPVTVYRNDDAITWTSGMSIDCDGQPGSRCNPQADPYFQPDTAFHQSDGRALKADELPYVVVPLASSRWNYANDGIRGGDLCVMVYRDKYVFGVVGDLGPSNRIGEASYAAAAALGINPDPSYGGVGSGVTYVVFRGNRVNPIESKAEAERLGAAKLAEWLGSSQPGEEVPVTTIYFEETGPQGTVAANKVVQTALNKWRTFDAALYVDGIYGPKTRERYRRWQVELFDTTDTDVSDGLPGITSLTALGKRSVYPFTVARKTTTPPPPPPSSEIPPVTSYLTVPEPAHNYTRVTYGGRTVNVRTRELLKLAAAWAGVSINLSQGSYSSGVSASAGTHDGGGVVDISVSAWSAATRDRVVLCLRKAGFAAWLRTPAEGFSYHIHACAIGDREMAAAAKRQVQAYFNGRNGLANNGADYFEHRWPNWADKYNQ